MLEAAASKRIFRTRPSALETLRQTSANQVIRQQREVKAVTDLPHPDCGILSTSAEQVNDKAGYVLSLNMTRPEDDQLSSLILVSQVVLTHCVLPCALPCVLQPGVWVSKKYIGGLRKQS